MYSDRTRGAQVRLSSIMLTEVLPTRGLARTSRNRGSKDANDSRNGTIKGMNSFRM